MSASQNTYIDYIRRLKEIRRLSTPSLEGIPDADSYSERLRDSFTRIGALAAENRAFLQAELFPVLGSDRPLALEELDMLFCLSDELLSAAEVENLDLPIMALISERLLKEGEARGDEALLYRSLDVRLDTCYALMTMMGRVSTCPELADCFRREGLSIGKRFLELLEPERLRALSASESRETVVTDARYASTLYEGTPAEGGGAEQLAWLDRMLALSEDPFYRALMPDYDWEYFRYRALNYYAKSTDYGNARSFGAEALSAIYDRSEAFADLWRSNPERFSALDPESQVRMLRARNRWLAGKAHRRDYLEEIVAMYHRRDPGQYNLNAIYDNLQLPAEALCALDPRRLTGQTQEDLSGLYRDMILYASRMPNNGSLSTLLEYFVSIVNRFIEFPGGIDFEEFMLECLAALHPPTYIHTVMVAKLTRCLCSHLIDSRPELLEGILGCETARDVVNDKDALCAFAWHAGLCHDFGKLTIIDTIFVYGRNLFDMEFEVIRSHPRAGWQLLARHASTRAYADAALGHHRWYDNSRGYPEDFDTSKSPIKPIIDLVLCADCLDAATDSVGRSYRRGKSYDDFVEEVRGECGTHYAPWLPELLTDPQTASDIRRMLLEERDETYRSTYRLLKRMQESGK